MEVLNRPTTNVAQENAICRSSCAHAPPEAMRNVQRIFNSGSYDLPTPVLAPGEVTEPTQASAVAQPAASETPTLIVAQEVAEQATDVDSDINTDSDPRLATPGPSSGEPAAANVDMSTVANVMDSCPAKLILDELIDAFTAIKAKIAANKDLLVGTAHLAECLSGFRSQLMLSASDLNPPRPAKPQIRTDLFTGVSVALGTASGTSYRSYASVSAAYTPIGTKRPRATAPRREYSHAELSACVKPLETPSLTPFSRSKLCAVHVKGFVPSRDTPLTAIIALLSNHGLAPRTIENISFVTYGITELTVCQDKVESLTTAINLAGLQISRTLNAKKPCHNESEAQAQAKFVARINGCIARIESQPRSPFFCNLLGFLIAYRDGDSNIPEYLPVQRPTTQFDSAFAPAPLVLIW